MKVSVSFPLWRWIQTIKWFLSLIRTTTRAMAPWGGRHLLNVTDPAIERVPYDSLPEIYRAIESVANCRQTAVASIVT